MPVEDPLWSAGFLSALVHELRTPVASLLLTAEMLADDERLDAQQARYARTLEAAAADLRGLLEDLSELNRLRGGRVSAQSATADVDELLTETVASLGDAVAARGAALTTTRAAGAPATLRCDRALLGRAVGSLVRSALAAGARRLELRVEPAAGDGGQPAIALIDDGTPPSPAELAALLQPFAGGGARTRRLHGGNGLDLPIAAAVAGALGGTLTAATDAQGTVLRLQLPP